MEKARHTTFCKRIECKWNDYDKEENGYVCKKIFLHIDKEGQCEIAGYFDKRGNHTLKGEINGNTGQ